jgi:segregation and condensation protein B
MNKLAAVLEAVLFVADEPVTTHELAQISDETPGAVTQALEDLGSTLDAGHGLVLKEVAGGWRLYTDESVITYVKRYASTDRAKRLSNAALETLSVVAYKQPVSRGQVSEIRGVDSEHAMKTLERRDLVVEVGRAPGPGQAALYATSSLFLEKMGIASVADLPPLADHVPPSQIMETLEMPMRPESSSNDSTS